MYDDQVGCEWVNVFFWYRPTRVALDKRLLITLCVCVCVCVCLCVELTGCWCVEWSGCNSSGGEGRSH